MKILRGYLKETLEKIPKYSLKEFLKQSLEEPIPGVISEQIYRDILDGI